MRAYNAAKKCIESGDRSAMPASPIDYFKFEREGAALKVTGRLVLLPIPEQEAIYEQIESEYEDHIAQLNAMGENALEAKTLELDAKPKSKFRMFKGPAAQEARGEGRTEHGTDLEPTRAIPERKDAP